MGRRLRPFFIGYAQMKNPFAQLLALVCLAITAQAQNWTTVSASNLTDLNQQKLAAGSMCFLGTDQNDVPISFEVGGGGQVLARPFCVTVANGSSAALSVPNPQNTQPQGIYYRVTVTDSSTGQTVLRYAAVSFSGGSFNLDQYAPQYPGLVTAPGSTSTPGNFTVNGNLSVTGSISGTYIFGTSPFSGLSGSAGYGTFQSVSDKQRGAFIQSYLQTHWVPISPWLSLDNYAKGDAVYLNAACSFTSASYTVTCTGANFSGSTDVGKLVVLYGARANGSGATATTTLSSGAVTAPTVTVAGSGYLTAPSVTVSGLTCTYNPELKAVLSGANYATGNTVSSITVVYGGSGCTGTPSITITAGPNLALAGAIASVTSSTVIVLTTNIAPSVTASSLSMLYGSDDTSNLNSAIAALAPNSDTGLNPLAVYCGRLYMTTGAVNVINKSLNLVSPGPANLSSTGGGAPAQQGCGIFLDNQSYTVPTDAIYMAGTQFSSISGVHIYSVSGNKQNSAIRLQQPASTNHNNQLNRFQDNIIGQMYSGGANGNDPETTSCFTGSFILNQCAHFKWGFMLDSPAGYPTIGGANNDQMVFGNNRVEAADIGFYQFSNQSAQLLLDAFKCDGCNVGIQATANLIVRDADISNSPNCDIVLGDPNYSGNNLGIVLDLQHFTDEQGHQFLCGSAQTSAVNNISVFFHGQNNFQVGTYTIKSGTIVDFSGQNFGPNLSVTGDQNVVPNLLGTLPATTAPVNFNWYPAGASRGPSLVQNGPDLAANVQGVPMAAFSNLQLTYPDFRNSQWIKRDWYLGTVSGHRCHTDMIFFGGDPDSIECNNTTVLGKDRVFGELLVNAIGTPASPTCAKLSGTGATTYFYKIAGVVAGIVGPASAETSCASQNASLSSSTVNQACAVPVAGAQQYAIYEATTTSAEKLLATVNADKMIDGTNDQVCYNDAAAGAAGATPNPTDTTGGATFQGPVTASGLTLTGSTITAFPSGISIDATMTKVPHYPWNVYIDTAGNNTALGVAEWVNSGPVKITGLIAIAGSASVGCTSSTQFWVHNVTANTDSTAATLANGQGSSSNTLGLSFAAASGDSLLLRYTATGCTTSPRFINVTVDIQAQ